ncbi:MAG: hypothetical protein MUO54_05385, partial [Anaerolineales bacterium]|nr:hypothetical protein [Anaerolineales bacterium]
MNTIQIVAISSKLAFPKLLRESLKGYTQSLPPCQINHISSLKEEIPEDLKEFTRVVLVDLESLPDDREVILSCIQDNFPGRSLILVSEGDQTETFSSISGEEHQYSINLNDISSPLFPSLLLTLITQSDLVQENRFVKDNLATRENELLSLRKASLHLTLNLSLDAVLEAILEIALELVSASDTHIFLYEHGVLSFGA